MTAELIDQTERTQIQDELGETLFVEAGAGVGKTTSLIQRVASLIRSGVALEKIAVITFTRKATIELRVRIREEIESQELDVATDDLDKTTISTLHSFAQLILANYPTQAGLPYSFSVMDELEAKEDFKKRWRNFLDNLFLDDLFLDDLLLDGPDANNTAANKIAANNTKIELALKCGRSLGLDIHYARGDLYDMAWKFEENWHMLTKRKDVTLSKSSLPEPPGFNHHSILQAVGFILENAEPLYKGSAQKPRFQNFSLKAESFLKEFAQDPQSIQAFLELNEDLLPLPAFKEDHPCAAHLRNFEKLVKDLTQYVLQLWEILLTEFTLSGVKERCIQGKPRFHDLLVLAKELLEHPDHGEKSRTELREKFPHILIDEFQDTDPIQLDIARLIATKPGESIPEKGALFLVGDPKQSIYRFRGASNSNYIKAKKEIPSKNPNLVQNFRTLEPIINGVNAIFNNIENFENVELQAFRKIPASEERAIGSPLIFLDGLVSENEKGEKKKADELRQDEADQICASIIWMITEKWKVQDELTQEWRPVRLSDVCVLIRNRTGFPIYKNAFQKAQIPFSLELGQHIYESPEVRTLIDVLTALEDPNNHFSVVNALRSPLFGCSDRDLAEFKRDHQQSWSYLKDCPDCPEQNHIVHKGLEGLKNLEASSHELELSQLVGEIIASRLQLELAHHSYSPYIFNAESENLNLFLNEIRVFSASASPTLTELLKWVKSEIAIRARYKPPSASLEQEAVKIMTIHGAKGLEFPVVVVAGMLNKTRAIQWDRLLTNEAGELCMAFEKNLSTTKYANYREVDEQEEDAENLRLLYVACTRARDHLLLGCSPNAFKGSRAKIMWDAFQKSLALAPLGGMGNAGGEGGNGGEGAGVPKELSFIQNLPEDLPQYLPEDAQMPESQIPKKEPQIPKKEEPKIKYENWRIQREQTLIQAEKQGVISTADIKRMLEGEETEISDEVEIDAETEISDEEQNARGRLSKIKGTSIGTAVHAVLQNLDFRSNFPQNGTELESEIEGFSKYFAEQEDFAPDDIYGSQNIIKETVLQIMSSDTIAEARAAEIMKKEIRIQAPLYSEIIFNGFIDLLYASPAKKTSQKKATPKKGGAGLDYTIVDYKTTGDLSDESLDKLMEYYKFQGAGYVLALQKITNEELPNMVFIFANSTGMRERKLEGNILTETIQKIEQSLF